MTPRLHSLTGSLKTLSHDLWADGRGPILLAVSGGWALSIGVRFVYPALVPFIRSAFGIGLATTGLVLTLLWGAYALGHVPGGMLGDRIGEGRTLVLSTAISAGAVLVVAAAVDTWMLVAGTVAFGLATALYGPTRFTIFTDIYPTRSGTAVGLTMAAGNIANTVLPAVTAAIAAALTWRLGFGLFVPLFGAVGLALWVVVPSRTSAPTSAVDQLSLATFEQLAGGITRASIPTYVAIQTGLSFIIQGFASFYPTYLSVTKGLSPQRAATVFGLFFAVGAVIQPISGGLMARVGPRRTLLGFLLGSALALWLLPFTTGIGPLVAVTVLFSCWNGCPVVAQTYIADAIPAEMQGTGFGTVKAGWMLLGATAPLLMGTLAESDAFDAAFVLLAVVGTAVVGLAAVACPAR